MTNSWFVKRNKCPACSSDNFKTIYKNQYDEGPVKDYLMDFYASQGKVELDYLKGVSYILSECDSCGLIFQRDIPDDSLMERLYEHWIDPHKTFIQQQENKYTLGYYSYISQEIKQIMAHFRTKPSSLSFFDFGMGWGKWALMAKAFGCDSYGTDLSSERIDYARANGINVIEWEDIPQHRFDFINTEQVFEHIPEPLETLCHLKTALKSHGLIKISVPNGNDMDRRLKIMDWNAPKGSRNSLNPVAPLEHINCFKRASILMMAKEALMEEVFIPLKVQYGHLTDWSSPKRILRNISRPIYRNLLKRQTYIFLRNKK